jgi:hypothetical protein
MVTIQQLKDQRKLTFKISPLTFRYRMCTLCPKGHKCEDKSQEPEICPEGTYAGVGKTECLDCPRGYSCSVGTSRPIRCSKNDVKCETNVSNPKRELATSCAAGDYWDKDVTCLSCAEGYTCAGGTNAPVACTGFTYSAAGANSCTVSVSNHLISLMKSIFQI